MLVAKPFFGYEHMSNAASHTAPRVISEVRKVPEVAGIVAREPLRARISGNLEVSIGLDSSCSSRKVIIRGGYIHVALLQSSPGFRLPLRHLSIRAGPVPFSLCLVKGQTVLLTLKIPTDRLFEIWLKTLAIEIIRQTPLEAVKYLDILTLTDPKYRNINSTIPQQKSIPINNDQQQSEQQTNITNNYQICDLQQQTCFICPTGNNSLTDINRNNVCLSANYNQIVPSTNPPVERQRVAVLLKKCQSAESYVPVKEKLVLFESLCRMGRISNPTGLTEDLLLSSSVNGQTNNVSKRARSMHDLSYCFTNAGVREICKYFETKSDDCGINRTDRRLIHSDSNLNAVRIKFIRNFEAHA